MGNCNFKAEKDKDSVDAISKNHFQYQYAIGRGGFGKVWRVEKKKEKEVYAMKEMSKARVMAKKSVQSVMNELKLLSQMRSPFLVNMHYAFQDRENLFLVMDLLLGGDLRYHIARKRKFTEEETKFFIACLVQALEVVHGYGIIHRDIKPENMVFDSDGYLRLTDFGIARYWSPDNA
mmetsp:Transcript_11127/g.11215  ORF Transcript_11127/g.11215 Transcript_11127/m.11215 type:complete len:177 (+) Transcript_11127:19-549(+)|eukprot:CAMPEP_0170541804 /NCGR_PEP_ID=MMETSP0211-20121228/1433_1 /TAXON_ID=311385 /ORGANISM="Pseudokeronopsis sp., Strain OXSARD2" /LENGTH=176 /DNA_ID=CAMNT_0010844667 /DNA_START=19 /DNA_END=549 /DNA_ORIENTATION=-